MEDLQSLLQAGEMDMTIFFRALARIDGDEPSPQPFADAFYDETKRVAVAPLLSAWLQRYRQRLQSDPLDSVARANRMNVANPRFVLRNYLAQQAIDQAEQGDASGIAELLEVMRRPYEEQPGREAYAARRPEWARDRAGCSMLSCSS